MSYPTYAITSAGTLLRSLNTCRVYVVYKQALETNLLCNLQARWQQLPKRKKCACKSIVCMEMAHNSGRTDPLNAFPSVCTAPVMHHCYLNGTPAWLLPAFAAVNMNGESGRRDVQINFMTEPINRWRVKVDEKNAFRYKEINKKYVDNGNVTHLLLFKSFTTPNKTVQFSYRKALSG